MDSMRQEIGLVEMTSLEGDKYWGGIYGRAVALDCYECDVTKFTRRHITVYFEGLVKLLGMEAGDLHFWDDVGVPEGQKQTRLETKGTSAVQFILTSSITLHALDILERVYVDVFSCKDFNEGDVLRYTQTFFNAESVRTHTITRV